MVNTALEPPPAPERPTFAEVYRSELAYAWRLLRRLGVSEADLEDAAHDAFLVVHRRLTDYDPARPLRPWIAGITVRVASERRRRAHRRREVPDASLDPVDTRVAAEQERREARVLLARALEALRPDRRVVVVLHDLEGHSMPEIVEIVEAPLNTLYSRLRLGRRDLAAAVRRLREGGEP